MAMANNDEKEIKGVDPLKDAGKLYNTFVELAKIARVASESEPSQSFEYRRGWDHPLGLALSTKR